MLCSRFFESGQQTVKNAAGHHQQPVVVGNGFVQSGQHAFDAAGLGWLHAADVKKMYQTAKATEGWRFKIETRQQDF